MSDRVQVPEHLLGDQRDSTWGDMSKYAVHFTSSAATLGAILGTGYLKASGPFGFSWFRKLADVREHHRSVCFSEVPIDRIERVTRRHGNYGIAFTKDFLRQRHAARVWYLDQGSSQALALSAQLKGLSASRDYTDPVWNLTPFIDLVMPGTYEWDWEREWRVRGDMTFTLDDVAFVITPESVDELPSLDGFYIHPKHDLIVAASNQPLEEYVEALVQQFFQTFEDPANSLPVDKGEYVWIVTEWETEEAVEELFFDVQERIKTQLVGYLNDVCWSWVRSDEVASIYE